MNAVVVESIPYCCKYGTPAHILHKGKNYCIDCLADLHLVTPEKDAAQALMYVGLSITNTLGGSAVQVTSIEDDVARTDGELEIYLPYYALAVRYMYL